MQHLLLHTSPASPQTIKIKRKNQNTTHAHPNEQQTKIQNITQQNIETKTQRNTQQFYNNIPWYSLPTLTGPVIRTTALEIKIKTKRKHTIHNNKVHHQIHSPTLSPGGVVPLPVGMVDPRHPAIPVQRR